MARGKKTPEHKKEAIRAVLAVNPEASSKEIAKVVDLPDSNLHSILVRFQPVPEGLYEIAVDNLHSILVRFQRDSI